MKKLLIAVLLILSSSSYASKFDSSYTSIKEKDCKLIQFIEAGGSSSSSCPGFGEFKVEVHEGDLRQSITLIRDGREYPLNLWTTHFSVLGLLIEWRYKKGRSRQLVGVITRLNVNDHPTNPNKTTSYLLVNKITRGEICLVGKIRPQANQNIKARRMAERSSKLPCIQ